jgi:hypothetical protein
LCGLPLTLCTVISTATAYVTYSTSAQQIHAVTKYTLLLASKTLFGMMNTEGLLKFSLPFRCAIDVDNWVICPTIQCKISNKVMVWLRSDLRFLAVHETTGLCLQVSVSVSSNALKKTFCHTKLWQNCKRSTSSCHHHTFSVQPLTGRLSTAGHIVVCAVRAITYFCYDFRLACDLKISSGGTLPSRCKAHIQKITKSVFKGMIASRVEGLKAL